MTSYLSIKIATQLKWGVLIYLACKSVTYLSIFEKQKIFAKTIFLKMHFKIGFVAKIKNEKSDFDEKGMT